MSDKQENKETKPLDDGDINLLKKYGMGPYSESIKTLEEENKTMVTTINKMCGIKESDTGLSLPSQWDLVADQKLASVFNIIYHQEHPLPVATCNKIFKSPLQNKDLYMVTIKHIAKYVVGLGEKVAPTDIEEGMRVGVERQKYAIQLPLPPRIDPSVTMMTVEEKPDVTYNEIGGCKE